MIFWIVAVSRFHGRASLPGRRWLFRFAVPEQLVVIVRKPAPFFVCCATSSGPRNHRYTQCVFYDFSPVFQWPPFNHVAFGRYERPSLVTGCDLVRLFPARCCLNANHRVQYTSLASPGGPEPSFVILIGRTGCILIERTPSGPFGCSLNLRLLKKSFSLFSSLFVYLEDLADSDVSRKNSHG